MESQCWPVPHVLHSSVTRPTDKPELLVWLLQHTPLTYPHVYVDLQLCHGLVRLHQTNKHIHTPIKLADTKYEDSSGDMGSRECCILMAHTLLALYILPKLKHSSPIHVLFWFTGFRCSKWGTVAVGLHVCGGIMLLMFQHLHIQFRH